MRRASYAAKVMSLGVFAKAVLMASVVTIVGATTFGESLILVLVSASATGVFALLVVLIQVRAERSLHARIDALEEKGTEIVERTTAIGDQTTKIADKVNGEESHT